MNIKTKSIITLCLTALASMPLSAQSYFGSVVDIDGTYTTAKNIKVEANQVVFTDHKDATHTIASNHGYSTPVKVIHDVLYCENDETMNSELVNKAVKTGQLTLSGTLNNHNWSLLNEGKLNGITSAHFHNVIGDEAFTALSNLKCSSLSYVTFEDCSFPNVTSLERLLYGSAITSFTWGGMNVSGNLNTLSYMFHDCQSLQSVSLKGLNTNNVTSLNNLFYNCKNLSNIDLSGCDFISVTDCGNMFYNCDKLQAIDLSGLKLQNVKTTNAMFRGCDMLASINFTDCDFSKVTSSTEMFQNCPRLQTVDLSGAKLSSNNCEGMFKYCNDLNSVTLSNCNFEGVTNCREMFRGCTSLKEIDLSGCKFIPADGADLYFMFVDCSSLETVDFSGCDLSKSTNNHEYLFYINCKALKTIRAVGCNDATITKLQEAINRSDNPSGVAIVTK